MIQAGAEGLGLTTKPDGLLEEGARQPEAIWPRGNTVLVSSHLLSEMQIMADHLVVIARGRLVAAESMDAFVARSTKNYELDRSVRHTKSAMGNISKLGVGVLINERPIPPGMKVEKPADGSVPTSGIMCFAY